MSANSPSNPQSKTTAKRPSTSNGKVWAKFLEQHRQAMAKPHCKTCPKLPPFEAIAPEQRSEMARQLAALAPAAWRVGNTKLAKDQLRSAFELSPDDDEVFRFGQDALRGEKQFQRTETAMAALMLAIHPEHPRGWARLVTYWCSLWGVDDSCLSSLTAALVSDERKALVQVLEERPKLLSNPNALFEALTDPKIEPVTRQWALWKAGGALASANAPEDALKAYDLARQCGEPSLQVQLDTAFVLRALGQTRAAVVQLEDLVPCLPDPSLRMLDDSDPIGTGKRAWMLLGELYEDLGFPLQTEQALEAVARWAGSTGNCDEQGRHLLQLAQHQFEQGLPKARATCLELLRVLPKTIAGWELMLAIERQDRNPEGVRMAAGGLVWAFGDSSKTTSPEDLLKVADAYILLTESKLVLKLLAHIPDGDANDWHVWLLKGKAYAQLGMLLESDTAFEKALSLAKTSEIDYDRIKTAMVLADARIYL